MDLGILSPQAILIISFNIFRVLCRRYGVYMLFGVIILVLQGFSGYFLLYYGIDDKIRFGEDGPRSDKIIEVDSKTKLSGNILAKHKFSDNGRNSQHDNQVSLNTDTHDKGPPSDANSGYYGDFGFSLPCEITNKEVISALQRAKTIECRKEIANISCEVGKGTFYPSRLVSFCPTSGHIRGRPLGCFKDSLDNRILGGYMVTLKKNSPSLCADICFQRGFIYSGVQYSKECFCGNKELASDDRVGDAECDMKCSGTMNKSLRCGGYLRISVIETGLAKSTPKPLRKPSNTTAPTVRIAYLLTVNGRSLRQIHRLFKALFHERHFFYIHVDSRQHYLYRELLKLEDRYPGHVTLSRQRFSSIWGGSSLLKVLLHCMKELLLKKEWRWDFVINLSETDFPIKTNKAVVEFLTANKERNFLKSHGHDTNKFLQKQGLDRTFLECETHMWRIGERKLPLGIRIDGGSDWVCLNRQFVEYITLSNDVLVDGLKKVFSYTLLPGETFFHTVLRNSEYCQTFTDNNLRVTNWKRKLGCRCQYKHIVDWCGCSPNDFTLKDWMKLEGSKNRNLFYGRKFEAVKSLEAINKVDEWLYGPFDSNTPNLHSFWENIFHLDDPPSGKDDAGLTLFHSTGRLSSKYLLDEHKCHLIPVLPTQAHSYHVDDHFHGLVIEFLARTKSGENVKLETLIVPKRILHKSSAEFAQRLIKMEVNSHFDLKEQMYRNFGAQLGPESDLSIGLWLSVDQSDGEKEEVQGEEETVMEVVLVDPLNALAAHVQLKMEDVEEVVTHSFNLNKPLRPGQWKAILIKDEVIVASLFFPVLPIQFVHGGQISVAEGRKLHAGPQKPYSVVSEDVLKIFKTSGNFDFSAGNFDFSAGNFDFSAPEVYPGNKTLGQEADKHSLYFGPQLNGWIDQIVMDSYKIEKMCHISSDNLPHCIKGSIPPCMDTLWSSHSPDPKDELTPVDPQTGRLLDPYRSKGTS